MANINLKHSIICAGGIKQYACYEVKVNPIIISAIADMRYKKRLFALCSSDHEKLLYAVGGWGENKYLKNSEVYMRKQNKWRESRELTEGKRNIATCGIGEAWVFAFSGANPLDVTTDISRLEVFAEEKGWKCVQLYS